MVILGLLKKIEVVLIAYYTTELCSIYFAVITHKTLLPIHQDKRLSAHWTFKNAGSKPVRGRFHSRATLTSKEALDT